MVIWCRDTEAAIWPCLRQSCPPSLGTSSTFKATREVISCALGLAWDSFRNGRVAHTLDWQCCSRDGGKAGHAALGGNSAQTQPADERLVTLRTGKNNGLICSRIPHVPWGAITDKTKRGEFNCLSSNGTCDSFCHWHTSLIWNSWTPRKEQGKWELLSFTLGEVIFSYSIFVPMWALRTYTALASSSFFMHLSH